MVFIISNLCVFQTFEELYMTIYYSEYNPEILPSAL